MFVQEKNPKKKKEKRKGKKRVSFEEIRQSQKKEPVTVIYFYLLVNSFIEYPTHLHSRGRIWRWPPMRRAGTERH